MCLLGDTQAEYNEVEHLYLLSMAVAAATLGIHHPEIITKMSDFAVLNLKQVNA